MNQKMISLTAFAALLACSANCLAEVPTRADSASSNEVADTLLTCARYVQVRAVASGNSNNYAIAGVMAAAYAKAAIQAAGPEYVKANQQKTQEIFDAQSSEYFRKLLERHGNRSVLMPQPPEHSEPTHKECMSALAKVSGVDETSESSLTSRVAALKKGTTRTEVDKVLGAPTSKLESDLRTDLLDYKEPPAKRVDNRSRKAQTDTENENVMPGCVLKLLDGILADSICY